MPEGRSGTPPVGRQPVTSRPAPRRSPPRRPASGTPPTATDSRSRAHPPPPARGWPGAGAGRAGAATRTPSWPARWPRRGGAAGRTAPRPAGRSHGPNRPGRAAGEAARPTAGTAYRPDAWPVRHRSRAEGPRFSRLPRTTPAVGPAPSGGAVAAITVPRGLVCRSVFSTGRPPLRGRWRPAGVPTSCVRPPDVETSSPNCLSHVEPANAEWGDWYKQHRLHRPSRFCKKH